MGKQGIFLFNSIDDLTLVIIPHFYKYPLFHLWPFVAQARASESKREQRLQIKLFLFVAQ